MAAVLMFAPAMAQDNYPSRPITLVVPAPPGGATDTLGRAYAEEMTRLLKVPVVVDNRAGATGTIGVQMVARAAPDGYTILFSHAAPVLQGPFVIPRIPYDVRKDLAFISKIAKAPLMLAVNSKLPATSLVELDAWAKRPDSNPTYGSFGVGSASHLFSSQISKLKGWNSTHVPYKGEAPLTQDIVAGLVTWGIASSGMLTPHIKAGRLRPIVVFADRRLKDFPDVPTSTEVGLVGQEFMPQSWFGVFTTAGTDSAILAKIEAASREAVHSTSVRSRMQIFGSEPVGNSSKAFREEFDLQADVVEKMIDASGARQE